MIDCLLLHQIVILSIFIDLKETNDVRVVKSLQDRYLVQELLLGQRGHLIPLVDLDGALLAGEFVGAGFNLRETS
jgi:hypothetical protein